MNPTIGSTVAVLAGGVGAARFLCGLIQIIAPDKITAIVNTADDTELHGLNISPDIDTVIYTLAGAIDPERSWGLRDETWTAMNALKKYETVRPSGSHAAPTWFNLGDQDLATHFYRTARLAEGASLTQVTDEIARAWNLGINIRPMTNHRIRTQVRLGENGPAGSKGTYISFQEYFVKYQHSVVIDDVRFDGGETAPFACGSDLQSATAVIIAPSNPIVSIGPIRELRGVNEMLRTRRDSVVAISPIVAGSALKGPADRLLVELGHESSVVGVARIYSPICGTLVSDNADAHLADAVRAQGMNCVVTDTVMKDAVISRNLAATTLGAVT